MPSDMQQLLAAPAIPALVADPRRLAALESYAILDTPAEQGFDAIVHLASQLCAVPVALVSLVAGDRQWFKAGVGFPARETDLDRSVCAHALAQPDRLLVIPDLTADPRTRDNPLVTGEPFIRFYAGAPLVTSEGQVLGSLCAIDGKPRPSGLTEAQARNLEALASQVVTQLELRRAVSNLDAIRAREKHAFRAREALRDAQAAVTAAEGDLDAVLHAVVTGAMRAVPAAEGGVVELIDGDALEYRAVRGCLTRHRGLRVPRQGTVAWHCATTRMPQLVVDAETDPHVHRELGLMLDLRSAILTPLLRGDAVLGVLKLQAGRPGAFSEGDLAQAGLFAGAATNGFATAQARAEVRAKDAYWRGLFERLREGLVIGEVIRDGKGAVTDWRYLEVNAAWTDLTGMADAVGRTIRETFPDIEEGWIDDAGDAVDLGEPVTFTRRLGQIERWFEGRISALGPDSFVILFLDVTERRRIEQALALGSERKAALARLGDHLRATMDADAMGFTAAAIVGQALGAAQAAYATVNPVAETATIASCWCAAGTVRLTGSHGFREYGAYVDALKAGNTVTVGDVERDERTRDWADAFRALGVAAFINVPVVEHGELVAIFLAHFAHPRALGREEEDFVRAAADRARAGIARVRAEERQAILNGEISHRLKNSMAMIQGIANQTLKRVADRGAVQSFEQRLMALSTAHDVLLRTDWETADLGEVVGRALDTAGVGGHCDVGGPTVTLGPRAALSTSLLLHELATNALKYGALTAGAGRIAVRWRLDDEAGELVLDWRESGGPPAVEPTRKGFGSRLLRMGLTGTGGSEVSYRPSGLEATFRAPRKQIEQA